MFVILTKDEDGKPEGIAFVKAATSEKAKEIVGIDKGDYEWVIAPLDALTTLEAAKAGYIEKTF